METPTMSPGCSDIVCKKPLLVLINPYSGRKKAKKMFKRVLQPKLMKDCCEYEVICTKYAGHAKEIVQTLNLDCYAGIVTISGDGLLFEVFNGLYCLQNWKELLKMCPVGIVPAGSGNALYCSLLWQLGKPLDDVFSLSAEHSANNIAIGYKNDSTVSLDVIAVETVDKKKLLSFFGVTIGLIADSDFGSESFRCLGYLRAYLMAFYRIVFPKIYSARVSYLPVQDCSNHLHNNSMESLKLKMPPLGEPLPDGWITEEGLYILVYALNLPMLDPLTLMSPESRLDDGKIWLVLVRSTITTREMIRCFMNVKTGEHAGIKGVDLFPVQAFRIEPLWPRHGYLSIDAEKCSYGPVQGQIIPKVAKIYADS